VRLPSIPGQLTYSSNVHPGESIEEVLNNLRTYTLPLRDRLEPEEAFGVGLWISARAARELEENPSRLEQLRKFLTQERLDLFTVNAFPFGNFHAASVKEEVYRPDWTDRRRIEYTLQLGRVLSKLLPKGAAVSISTLSGTCREWNNTPETQRQIAQNFIEVAQAFRSLFETSGRHLMLALEPEPLTTLETAQDAISFFNDHIFPLGPERITDHLGLCLDTCHESVSFGKLDAALRSLSQAKIPVHKIQLSSALEIEHPGDNPQALEQLQTFAEDRYLHQVVCLDEEGAPLVHRDLPQLLSSPDEFWLSRPAWRIHFHVPIDLDEIGFLKTTRKDLLDTLNFLNDASGSSFPHLEIETYTWEVLPEKQRPNGPTALIDGIEREYRSVLELLA
jgi:sugar phosphate isomerase/epimerase